MCVYVCVHTLFILLCALTHLHYVLLYIVSALYMRCVCSGGVWVFIIPLSPANIETLLNILFLAENEHFVSTCLKYFLIVLDCVSFPKYKLWNFNHVLNQTAAHLIDEKTFLEFKSNSAPFCQ